MNPPPLPSEKSDDTYTVAPPPVTPPPAAGKATPIKPREDAPATSTAKTKPETERKYPCIECGARMEYDPSAKAMKCPYCGHTDKVPEKTDGKVQERDYETYLKKLEKQKTGKMPDVHAQVRCTGCGALVTFDDKVVADQCPYCLTHLENLPQTADEVILPESVLPFSVANRDAVNNFRQWVASRWFAPNALKELANLGQLQGFYLPYFTYDAMTHTQYSGRRGVNYSYTVTDSEGKGRTEIRIDWSFVSGQLEHFFDDVLVCSSKRLPNDLVNGLTPWDLDKLVPFSADYLSGFKTERYSIEMPDGFQIARKYMENELVVMVRRDIGGDHQEIVDRQSDYMGISFKHLLLPVWMTSYRYNDQIYQVLVNGRTGEVQGYRPYSIWKIASTVMLVLAIIGLIYYLVSGNKHKQPRRMSESAIPTLVANGETRKSIKARRAAWRQPAVDA